MISEIATEKLEKLKAKLESGEVHQITRRGGVQMASRMGDKTGSPPMPHLSGVIKGYTLNLDVKPYPDGGFLVDAQISVKCPFKLSITRENADVKSTKFKSAGPVPIQEIEIGVKDFDDRYFIETLEEEQVKKFLSSPDARSLIMDLEDVDALNMQYKCLMVLYYIKDLDEMDTDWLYKKIEILTKIGDQLKA